MAKINKVVIDSQKTLGNLTFLRCEERSVYLNGVKTSDFEYNITLLSEAVQGEVLVSKFPRKIDVPFGSSVELVGEVLLNSSVTGNGDFRSVANTLTAEDIRVKGQTQAPKENK